ncbi:MAG: hypothetical protein KDB04_11360 [Acidimicrobiales bacterium]|nr:hypothetical protein [Acidimicrobiales bacterium]HRW36733.1 hypothetical protein [Aquihabitans sp.]
MDTELDRILADDYLDGLEVRSTAELREQRAECQAVETQVSYLRRMVQGRHDIVAGELARRDGGDAPSDVSDLVDRLPEILADRIHAPGPGRLPASMEPGELHGALADRLAEITGRVPIESPGDADHEALASAEHDLRELEAEVSRCRRQLFDRIDAVQAEITRRYREGVAKVDDLLARGDEA